MIIHSRLCPKCEKEITYKSLVGYNKAIKDNNVCRSCSQIGNKNSLGKNKNKKPKEDLTNKIFNNWKVLGLSHREEEKVKLKGIWYWNLECIYCGFKVSRTTNYTKRSKNCPSCKPRNSRTTKNNPTTKNNSTSLKYSKGELGLNKIFSDYCGAAKLRNLYFDLTKEQFKNLTSSRCNYCKSPPNKTEIIYRAGKVFDFGSYIHTGIDRLDNNKGYTLENSVPCCTLCNNAKGALSLFEWMNYLDTLADNAKHNKIPCFGGTIFEFLQSTDELVSSKPNVEIPFGDIKFSSYCKNNLPKKDLTGKVFGNWQVLGLSHRDDKKNRWYWDIECTHCKIKTRKITNILVNSKNCNFCELRPKGETGFNKLLSHYRYTAKVEQRIFELTNPEFRKLTSSSCYYCGSIPSKIKNTSSGLEWGKYIYNGIDRIDNNIGYVIGNCVSCCIICNRGKRTIECSSWINHIQKLINSYRYLE